MNSQSFYSLSPDVILDSVEKSLASRCDGRVLALNSIENRVLLVELEEKEAVVAKFYRPGRWTPDQILEEHHFLRSLALEGIPVVEPIPLENSQFSTTLAQTSEGILYSIFPRVRGRLKTELNSDEVQHLGRFLARLHNVGAKTFLKARRTLDLETYGYESLDTLENSDCTQSPMGSRYLDLAAQTLPRLEVYLERLQYQCIHGDCHSGNVLWSDDGPFFLDFDDIVTGPPVQDVWMIFRSREEIDLKKRDLFLESYDEYRSFDYESLESIEALRALRMIHYSAWIQKRWDDPSFPKIFPNFGTDRWWEEEIQALYECIDHLEKNS